MTTAANEWAERVAARNAIETAKAQKYWQPSFLFNVAEMENENKRKAASVPLSAAGKEAE